MAEQTPGDRFTLSPRRITDADWFGHEANQTGTINVPTQNPYPTLPANRHHGISRPNLNTAVPPNASANPTGPL